jgi:hypothetical protein
MYTFVPGAHSASWTGAYSARWTGAHFSSRVIQIYMDRGHTLVARDHSARWTGEHFSSRATLS